jgi:hypothetical protein
MNNKRKKNKIDVQFQHTHTKKKTVTFQNYFILPSTPGRALSDAPNIVTIWVMPSKPNLSLPE